MSKNNRTNHTIIGQPLKGKVTRTTGVFCSVLGEENGKIIECTFKGKFRIDTKLRSTNPVAVGDEVMYSEIPGGDTGVVVEVLPRRNYILRKAIAHARKVHILCANIDQAVLVFTLKSPRTSMGFANRFLLIAEAYGIPAVIILNKADTLISPEDKEMIVAFQKCYASVPYPISIVSALDKSYQKGLMDIFSEKTTFLGGHSGSGKSSILNLLAPELQLKTGEISGYNDKGVHTTTFSEMHLLPNHTCIIDAPGIKEMGLVDFDKNELCHYFPEMRNRMNQCKFNNCTHIHEPKCAIREAVQAGEIDPSRYDSYVKIFLDIEIE